MDWIDYLTHFENIIKAEDSPPPYDQPEYADYAKLNWSRTNRWLKHSPVNESTVAVIKSINEKQQWVLITEPWCGDAAHICPVIYLMSIVNPNISLTIQLRDSGSEIEQYLTNGTKSIPKLIVRDADGKDLFSWGPRPADAQVIFDDLKDRNASFEEAKIALQNFYNKDKAAGMQKELLKLFTSSIN